MGFQTRALARECVGGPGRRSTNRADARGSSPVRPLAPRHPPARAFRSRRGEIRRRRCPRTPRARSAMTGEPPSGSDPDPDVVCISDVSDVEPVELASDSEDLVCAKCGEGDDECNLVLCDECPQGFHVYCLRPKLPSVPRGAWRCPDCAEARARSVAHPNVGEHLVDADPGDSSDERRPARKRSPTPPTRRASDSPRARRPPPPPTTTISAWWRRNVRVCPRASAFVARRSRHTRLTTIPIMRARRRVPEVVAAGTRDSRYVLGGALSRGGLGFQRRGCGRHRVRSVWGGRRRE